MVYQRCNGVSSYSGAFPHVVHGSMIHGLKLISLRSYICFSLLIKPLAHLYCQSHILAKLVGLDSRNDCTISKHLHVFIVIPCSFMAVIYKRGESKKSYIRSKEKLHTGRNLGRPVTADNDVRQHMSPWRAISVQSFRKQSFRKRSKLSAPKQTSRSDIALHQ